ncbi:type II secretion system F family protein [Blastopirellula retiformator]|uniref:Type II secretion system protein F n=1 Tax=Blastopirellula retiformator TaxID=2527970 RepID=A0A5C5UZJ4_9BACT|nr:type II secretion system F family protein [Blastopirellula retiformator]TWT30912.1 Type II secretion system protein F [Blastopirellula retiformator]
MFFSPRIGLQTLVQLCRRVGTQLDAGVDDRTIWRREVERAHGAQRRVMEEIRDGVERGSTLGDALKRTGDYFPHVFREMVRLGDETGHLDRILQELSERYEHRLQLRRSFLAGIAWPMIQLIFAVVFVGLLIWFMGFLGRTTGKPIDILGFGLVGTSGMLTYFSIVGAIVFGSGVIWMFYRQGQLDFLPIGRIAMNIPGVGAPLKTIALSQMAWTLALTTGGGLDARRAIRLGLESTHSDYYTQFIDQVDREILAGEEIGDALRHTGVFPEEFLDAIYTGELTGRISEMMEKLSDDYQSRAKAALNMLAMIAGFGVWLLVAGLLVTLIFRIFFNAYLGPMNEALDDLNGF